MLILVYFFIDKRYNYCMDYDLNSIFQLSKDEKCGKILGILAMVLGAIVLFIVFIFGDSYFSDILYVGLLVLGLWLWGYGFMAWITMRPVWSLYYPTVSILIIASLPCIAAAITFRYAEWIEILSVCLSMVVSVVLFGVFAYFSIAKPTKARQNFVEENKKELTIKNRIKKHNNVFLQIKIYENNNGDRASIITKNNICQYVILEKNVGGFLQYIDKKRFVEMYNAEYYAVKFLIHIKRRWKF